MEAREARVSVTEFETLTEDWIADALYRQHSAQTIASRRHITGKLRWWLRHEGHESIGTKEIRDFLTYVGSPAPDGGRWGNPHETGQNRPRTVYTYWERLRTLFRWAVAEAAIQTSPMQTLRPPAARLDQIQPFTEQQVQALLVAARKSRYALRDEAIVLFLLDSAVRASELCSLQIKDLDLAGGKATVLGKGNKHRQAFFLDTTRDILQKYLNTKEHRPMDPVFHAERGACLTRSGLQQLIHRLGKAAGITGIRCSPHTFRHTAAISATRNGMNSFSLQIMLGHTDLTMTRRYVAIAQADVQEQHRLYSPVRHLMESGVGSAKLE